MASPALAFGWGAPGGGPTLAGGGHIISPLLRTMEPRTTSLLRSVLHPSFLWPNSPRYLTMLF